MSTGRCHREYGGKKEIVLSLGESQEGKIRLINTSMYNMRLKVDLKKKKERQFLDLAVHRLLITLCPASKNGTLGTSLMA